MHLTSWENISPLRRMLSHEVWGYVRNDTLFPIRFTTLTRALVKSSALQYIRNKVPFGKQTLSLHSPHDQRWILRKHRRTYTRMHSSQKNKVLTESCLEKHRHTNKNLMQSKHIRCTTSREQWRERAREQPRCDTFQWHQSVTPAINDKW